MVKNANTDSKHLREHFKRSDAAQKKLGTNLAGKPLPKQRSGITPGGRSYIATRVNSKNKVTTVNEPGTKHMYRKTTKTHTPSNSGNVARYGKTDTYKTKINMRGPDYKVSGMKDIKKGPTKPAKKK